MGKKSSSKSKTKIQKINARINQRAKEQDWDRRIAFERRHQVEKQKMQAEDLSPEENHQWQSSCRSRLDALWWGR